MKEIINRSCRCGQGSPSGERKCGGCANCTCGKEKRCGMEKRDYVVSGVVEEGPEDPEFFGLGAVNEAHEEGAGMGSVKWNMTFGSFPAFPGVADGMLSLHASYIRPFLASSAAFVYNHVTQRRVVVEERIGEDRIRVGVETPLGKVRFTEFDLLSPAGEEAVSSSFVHPLTAVKADGFRYGTALRPVNSDGEEMRSLDFTAYEEVLEDGTSLYYDRKTGEFMWLRMLNGVTMTREQFENELRIIRHSAVRSGEAREEERPMVLKQAGDIYHRRRGVMLQVWSRTDGLLDFVQVAGGYEIRHYPLKSVGSYNKETGRYDLVSGAEPVRKWNVLPGKRVRNENRTKDGIVYKCPDHMDSFAIVEQAGAESFSCKWLQPSPEQMIFVRGDGPDAEIVFKTRTDMDGRGKLYDHPITPGMCGRSMGIAGVPCGNLLEMRYYYKGEESLVDGTMVGVPCYSEQYLYQAFEFGNAITEKRVGLYLDKPLVTRYVYGTVGGSKGQCVLKTDPAGEVTGYNYDERGRLVSVKGTWAGGGSRITRYSYHDSRFNDRRPYTRTVLVAEGEEEAVLSRETYTYEFTATEYRRKTARTGLGVDTPLTSEEIISRDVSRPLALGRIVYNRDEKGVENWYDYAAVPAGENREHLPLVFKCTEESRIEGRIIANKSVRKASYYDKRGNVLIERNYVHTGADYTGTGEELRTYDCRNRLLETTSGKGTKTVRWGCHGPLDETDEDSMRTLYQYDSAGNKACVIRKGMLQSYQFEVHDTPPVSLPDSVMEFSYDGRKNLLRRKMKKGFCSSVAEKTYDAAGRLVMEMDAMGRKTLYTLDGLTETVASPGGGTFVTRYHADGHVLEASGTGRRALFYRYDLAEDGIRTRVSLDEAGERTISESVSDGLGRLLRVREPGGSGNWVDTGYIYNTQSLPIRIETRGRAPIVMTYDGFGDKTCEAQLLCGNTTPNQNTDRVRRMTRYYVLDSVSALGLYNIPMLRSTETLYSAEGLSLTTMREETLSPGYSCIRGALLERVEVITDVRDNDTLSWVENHQGNRVSVSLSPESPREERTLVMEGETIGIQYRDGTYMDYCPEYIREGKKVTRRDGRGNEEVSIFDLSGEEISFTDGSGCTARKRYDSGTGHLECVTQADLSCLLYRYDVRGRRVEECRPDGTCVKYGYDEDDHLISRETAFGKESGKEGLWEQWEYDSVSGSLLRGPGPGGVCLEYDYDSLGRLASMKMSGTESCVTYEYAPLTGELLSVFGLDGKPEVVFTYNHLGQPTSVTDRSGKRSFQYSITGDREQEVVEGEFVCLLDYARDRYGRITGSCLSVDDEPVRTETLSYDDAGRLSMASVNGQPALIYEYREDNGLPESVTYPSGLQKRMEYEEKRDQVCGIGYYRPQGTVAGILTVARDSAGRITELACERMGEERRIFDCRYDMSGNVVFSLREEEGEPTGSFDGQSSEESADSEWVERTCDYLGRCVQQTVYEGDFVKERKRYVYDGLLPVAELDAMHTGNGTDRIYQWDRSGFGLPCLVRMTEKSGDWESSYEYTHFWDNAVSEVWNSGGELVTSCDYGFADDSFRRDRSIGYPFPFPGTVTPVMLLNMISGSRKDREGDE